MILKHPSFITTTFTALAVFLGAAGCERYPLHDLGYTNGELSESNDPPEPLPPVAEFGSDFAGVWIGEAEDPFALQSNADDAPPTYRFPSGSKRIRLELVPSGNGLFSLATLTFGEGAPPAPATDPDVGYPVDPEFDINALSSLDSSVRPPVEGFVYSLGASNFHSQRDLDVAGITDGFELNQFIDEGRVLDGMLLVSYTTAEILGSWCALQTPATCPVNRGFFVDNDGTCFHGDDPFPTDCQKMALCEVGACFCEEENCSYSPAPSGDLTLRLSDEGLVGLFSGGVFLNERGFQQPLGTVHFRREAQ
jgi:hypothetical protein